MLDVNSGLILALMNITEFYTVNEDLHHYFYFISLFFVNVFSSLFLRKRRPTEIYHPKFIKSSLEKRKAKKEIVEDFYFTE